MASIVICTLNRARLLEDCLASLAALSLSAKRFEIIVVDNGSCDDTRAVAKRLSSSVPTLRYVHERRQGLSHARNCGLHEAQSDWVAYLDDDARVLPNYFEHLTQLVSRAEFDCVGGAYFPWYRDGQRSWFLDRYASNAALAETYGELPSTAFVSGGICVCRRDALLSIGGFRPDLGMKGARIAYGEETRVQVLLRRGGYRIGFDPGWRIEHYTPLAKQSLRWILRSAYARGRDSWRAFDDQVSVGRMVTLARKLITRPVRQLGRSFGDRAVWNSWRNPALSVLEPIALTVGQLAGGLREWRNGK